MTQAQSLLAALGRSTLSASPLPACLPGSPSAMVHPPSQGWGISARPHWLTSRRLPSKASSDALMGAGGLRARALLARSHIMWQVSSLRAPTARHGAQLHLPSKWREERRAALAVAAGDLKDRALHQATSTRRPAQRWHWPPPTGCGRSTHSTAKTLSWYAELVCGCLPAPAEEVQRRHRWPPGQAC